MQNRVQSTGQQLHLNTVMQVRVQDSGFTWTHAEQSTEYRTAASPEHSHARQSTGQRLHLNTCRTQYRTAASPEHRQDRIEYRAAASSEHKQGRIEYRTVASSEHMQDWVQSTEYMTGYLCKWKMHILTENNNKACSLPHSTFSNSSFTWTDAAQSIEYRMGYLCEWKIHIPTENKHTNKTGRRK